ncbi:Wzz/FepE/Etk N-terminal domain-containing protein [Spirosoma knui]
MSVVEEQITKQPDEGEVEIRLGDIVYFFKRNQRILLRSTIIFLILGAVYAFSQPDEYTSTVKVMPELKSPTGAGGLSDLKSLAGLAGVSLDNFNSTSEAIRPDLYPDIVKSVPFTLHILGQPVLSATSKKATSLHTYLKDQVESGWLSQITTSEDPAGSLTTPVSSDPARSTIRLTRQQEQLGESINERVNVYMDKKSGIVTITSQMPDATVAATVARYTLDYLTAYVTNYRTSKARKQVTFLTQQVNRARKRYESAEYQLSSYRDRNRSLFLNTAKIEEQRLQADFLLAQTVYNDLSKQLEQARIKVQEEAPVFQILEPPQVPLRKSGPKRVAIIMGFTIFGALLALIASFVFQLLRR